MAILRLPAWYYQQFDADYSLDVPGEGYGGWRREPIELAMEHTALVVMHAWDCGTRQQFPGWYRAVEYIQRSGRICEEVFPPLLAAVRKAGMTLFHVVGGGDYFKSCQGYRRAVELAGPPPEPTQVQLAADEQIKTLRKLYPRRVFPGPLNGEDCRRGFESVDFAPQARPVGDEGVAADSRQLLALCLDAGINHLVYTGFAINYCLTSSPGGMVDMSRYGLMCSTVRQATTAVENKETARDELHKQEALWLTSLMFGGFVFDADDFQAALAAPSV
jgi:hypothetical protein